MYMLIKCKDCENTIFRWMMGQGQTNALARTQFFLNNDNDLLLILWKSALITISTEHFYIYCNFSTIIFYHDIFLSIATSPPPYSSSHTANKFVNWFENKIKQTRTACN